MSTSQQPQKDDSPFTSSESISKYDITLDPNMDLILKNLKSTYALQKDNSPDSFMKDSYEKCKHLTTFKSSPNVILLFGEYSSDCELLAYNLHTKLTQSKDSSTFLEIHENDQWNPNLPTTLSVLVSSYKDYYEKLTTISDILLNPGNTKWLYIVTTKLCTDIIFLIEMFPHWIFMIPPYITTKEEYSYVDILYSHIITTPNGIQDFSFPIYSFHSTKWFNLMETKKNLTLSSCKSSLLKPKK